MGKLVKTFMVIDDNEIDNFVTKSAIEMNNEKNEAFVHTIGVSALEQLESSKMLQEARNIDIFPEVIFLDIRMPLMDGWEFLKGFQHEYLESGIAVYMLTSSRNESDIAKAKNNPMVKGYIIKPLDVNTIKEIKEDYNNVDIPFKIVGL